MRFFEQQCLTKTRIVNKANKAQNHPEQNIWMGINLPKDPRLPPWIHTFLYTNFSTWCATIVGTSLPVATSAGVLKFEHVRLNRHLSTAPGLFLAIPCGPILCTVSRLESCAKAVIWKDVGPLEHWQNWSRRCRSCTRQSNDCRRCEIEKVLVLSGPRSSSARPDWDGDLH